jgi:hypothetical protein
VGTIGLRLTLNVQVIVRELEELTIKLKMEAKWTDMVPCSLPPHGIPHLRVPLPRSDNLPAIRVVNSGMAGDVSMASLNRNDLKNITEHISIQLTNNKCSALPCANRDRAEPAACRGMKKETMNLLGKGSAISILRLWLNHAFGIHA